MSKCPTGFKNHLKNALKKFVDLGRFFDVEIPDETSLLVKVYARHDSRACYNQKTRAVHLSRDCFRDSTIAREKSLFHELIHYFEDQFFEFKIDDYHSPFSEGFALYFEQLFFNPKVNDFVEQLLRLRFSKNYKHYSAGYFIFRWLYEHDKKKLLQFMSTPATPSKLVNFNRVIEKLVHREPRWMDRMLGANVDFIIRGEKRYYSLIYRPSTDDNGDYIFDSPLIIPFDYDMSGNIMTSLRKRPVYNPSWGRFLDRQSNEYCFSTPVSLHRQVSRLYAHYFKYIQDVNSPLKLLPLPKRL